MHAVTEFGQFYQQAYGQFEQQYRTAGSLPADMFIVNQDSHETLDMGVSGISMSMLLSDPLSLTCKIDAGDGWTELECQKNCIIVHSPNTDVMYHAEGRHSIMGLSADQKDLDRLLLPAGIKFTDTLNSIFNKDFNDPIVTRSIRQMWKQSQTQGPAASLMVDAQFHTLLARLVTLAGQTIKVSKTQLSNRELSRAIELIEANMEDAITITELSKALDMSDFHFSRAFKLATGEGPHAFMTERRMARACDLLANSKEQLAEIAYACGFSSQSHFTTVFRKTMGETPGRYRMEMRG